MGGYLKIAPRAHRAGPLTKMMKPGIGTYDRFKQMFEKFTRRGRQEAVPHSRTSSPPTPAPATKT